MLPSPLGPKTRGYGTEQSRFAFPITVKISAWRHTIFQAFLMKGTDTGWMDFIRYPETLPWKAYSEHQGLVFIVQISRAYQEWTNKTRPVH